MGGRLTQRFPQLMGELMGEPLTQLIPQLLPQPLGELMGELVGERITQLMGEPLGEFLRELLTQLLGEFMGELMGELLGGLSTPLCPHSPNSVRFSILHADFAFARWGLGISSYLAWALGLDWVFGIWVLGISLSLCLRVDAPDSGSAFALRESGDTIRTPEFNAHLGVQWPQSASVGSTRRPAVDS